MFVFGSVVEPDGAEDVRTLPGLMKPKASAAVQPHTQGRTSRPPVAGANAPR